MRRLGAVATSEARLEMGIGDKATVDADVLFGHSSDREPALECLANSAAIELPHPRYRLDRLGVALNQKNP